MSDYILPRFSANSITGYRGKMNPWLLFHRFLNGESKERSKRLEIFRTRADLSSLKSYAGRERAARQAWRNRYGADTILEMTLSLVDRMSVGMGIESDFENGLLLHWIHGFPYVNGEALKGAARAWAAENREHEKNPNRFARIFGSLNKQEAEHEALFRGKVIFFDAIPESESNCFDIDIITPHYAEYYTGEPPKPPGGWEQPNPVAFLTVSAGAPFVFSLAGYEPELVRLAGEWLKAALITRGLGAKKRAGYGHFSDAGNNDHHKTAQQVSALEKFLTKIDGIDHSKLSGVAAELVKEIKKLPEKDHAEAGRALLERIPKNTLRKKAKKEWVITLMNCIG